MAFTGEEVDFYSRSGAVRICMSGDAWRERAGCASRRLNCAASEASMEADRRGSARALALIPAGTEAIRTMKRRVADSAGPFPFAPKSVLRGAPQRVQFGLGSIGASFGPNQRKTGS